MVKAAVTKTLFCGALALAGAMASLPSAEAAAVRVRFTPEYGIPFPNLEWFGEAVVDDGGCGSSGNVSNLTGGCAGDFTVSNATVYFANKANPTVALGHVDFTGGQVISVNRNSPAPPDWTQIISTPFNSEPGPAGVTEALYKGNTAYFSLVFIGGYAQLYWFQKDPGDPLLNPLAFPYVNFASAPYYLLCYQEGDNKIGGYLGIAQNHCGISSNVGGAGEGGILQFAAAIEEVPEPNSLALLLAAGLAGLGWQRLRGARSTSAV